MAKRSNQGDPEENHGYIPPERETQGSGNSGNPVRVLFVIGLVMLGAMIFVLLGGGAVVIFDLLNHSTPTSIALDTPLFTTVAQPGTALPSAVPSSTPALPPGVYITDLVSSPASPHFHDEVTFRVTFLNSTGTVQNFKWFVSIWLPVQSNRFGQTSWDRSFAIQPGRSSLETYSPGWKLTGPDSHYSGCVPFTARVQWKDPPPDNTEPYFVDTTGQPFQSQFQVCPP